MKSKVQQERLKVRGSGRKREKQRGREGKTEEYRGRYRSEEERKKATDRGGGS